MRVLFAAGGTGGHVFPALVVAKEVMRKKEDAEILFVGTPRGMENELVSQAGFRLELVSISGMKRKSIFAKLKTIVALPLAFFRSWRILRRFRPTAVFGIGGYASGPIILLASMLGYRTGIMEPNAVAGFSNRLLGRFVHKVFVAFEEAQVSFPPTKCMVTGNPIRKEILDISPPQFSEEMTILIFGGSQGAKKLNDVVLQTLDQLKKDRPKLRFIHQTGKTDREKVEKAYAEKGFDAEVQSFFTDMNRVYQESSLVIARSGSSVLEIAAVGRPSILVPYPYAADLHQHANAKAMEAKGASIVIDESDLTAETLSENILKMTKSREAFEKMSTGALRLRHAHAAKEIVESFEKWTEGRLAA